MLQYFEYVRKNLVSKSAAAFADHRVKSWYIYCIGLQRNENYVHITIVSSVYVDGVGELCIFVNNENESWTFAATPLFPYPLCIQVQK